MTPSTSQPTSQDARKLRPLELANSSQPPSTYDEELFLVEEDKVVELGWDNFREPYSPWTGVKTAVTISAILILFVVYITVRTRCTPDCRSEVVVRLRRAVRWLVPSWMLPRRLRSDEDDAKYRRRQPPVVGESTEQCLRRVELELTQVINERKSSCSDHASDVTSVSQSATT